MNLKTANLTPNCIGGPGLLFRDDGSSADLTERQVPNLPLPPAWHTAYCEQMDLLDG